MSTSNCCSPDSEAFKKINSSAKFLQVISDVNRIKILCILSNEKICVCDLADKLILAQNLVSHHLKVLEEAGILEKNREGNQIFYSIIPTQAEKVENLKNLIGIN